eukprot:13047396-Alexandrium_andersonii.AAC.1
MPDPADIGAECGKALEKTMNITNAYSKLAAPAFPTPGMINSWLKNLAQDMARTSGFCDEK